MRLTKMFGLAAVAAVAAMAFVGTSSAMALFNTTLCKENSALECPKEKQYTLVSFLAGTTILKTSIVTVLCLHSVAKAEVEKDAEGNPITLGKPLNMKLHELDFLNCGTNAAHDNCTVTVEQLPLISVLKTEADLGTATINPELAAKVHVVCGELIDCTYSEPAAGKGFAVESAEHTEGAGRGMLTANELEVKKLAGGFFCPKVSKWTALYQPLEGESVWLRS